MKHNVQTSSYRDYGDDRTDLKPRIELLPFLDQRRVFAATLLRTRPTYDPKSGRFYRNGRFVDVYDLATGTQICRRKGTNTNHLWIKQKHWLDDWQMTDIDDMTKLSFVAKVARYTTEEKKRLYGKDYVTYGLKYVSDPINWLHYDTDMDMFADYMAGCPDIPHYSPEFTTFDPGLGNGQNPNTDDSEIPMN